MIICVCRRVSDRDIARAAREGCASFEALHTVLGVATACGKCRDSAREVFQQQAAGAACAATGALAGPAHGPVMSAPRRVLRIAPAA